MPDMKQTRSRDRIRGVGTLIGFGSLVAAAAGWVFYDLRKPDSVIRNLIEIGRAKVEGDGPGTERQIDAAADVEEAVQADNREDRPAEEIG